MSSKVTSLDDHRKKEIEQLDEFDLQVVRWMKCLYFTTEQLKQKNEELEEQVFRMNTKINRMCEAT